MAGKRLLDLAALFNVSRGVAQKHVALRARQLDVYNQTSSLARAVRNQTERVTETAKAASILASRLNESAPAWTSEASDENPAAQSKHGETIPGKDAVEDEGPLFQRKEGLEQDHFYERSQSTSTIDQKPTEDLEIKGEKANRYPLPDGTIPPAESNTETPELDHDIFSTRPKDEPTKEPLESDGLKPASSGASSIPIPTSRPLPSDTARRIQRQSEEQIPSKTADALGEISADSLEEGHDEDSFYRASGHTSPSLSSLPRFKIPKHPSSTQDGEAEGLNSDTFYNAGIRSSAVEIPELQAPEGVNTDLFYSPRIARMLGGKIHGAGEKELKLKGVKGMPVERTELARGKDQDTFSVRSSSQELPTHPEFSSDSKPATPQNSLDTKDTIEDFGQELAEDNQNQSNRVRHPTKWILALSADY